MKLRLRKAEESDVMLVFEWANDPVTRKMSFEQEKITLETHKKWFHDILSSKSHLLIVEFNKDDKWCPCAQVRFDESGEINVSIDHQYRGLHMASDIIKLSLSYAKEKLKMNKIIAHIKKENTPSIKAFEKAGFFFSKKTVIKNEQCLEYAYSFI